MGLGKLQGLGGGSFGGEIEGSRKCDFLPLLGTRDCYCLACEGEGSELVDDQFWFAAANFLYSTS